MLNGHAQGVESDGRDCTRLCWSLRNSIVPSPYLYKAVATGQNLSSAEIKWYRINYSGLEEEYFNMLPEDVRIVLISPAMTTGDNPNENPMETVELRYEKSPGRSILSLPEIYGHCNSQ